MPPCQNNPQRSPRDPCRPSARYQQQQHHRLLTQAQMNLDDLGYKDQGEGLIGTGARQIEAVAGA